MNLFFQIFSSFSFEWIFLECGTDKGSCLHNADNFLPFTHISSWNRGSLSSAFKLVALCRWMPPLLCMMKSALRWLNLKRSCEVQASIEKTIKMVLFAFNAFWVFNFATVLLISLFSPANKVFFSSRWSTPDFSFHASVSSQSSATQKRLGWINTVNEVPLLNNLWSDF